MSSINLPPQMLINQNIQGMNQPPSNMLILATEIDTDVASLLCARLLELNDVANKTGEMETIKLFINSPGGDLNAGWMICDIMDMIDIPIETIGLGLVASAGLLIFMNGDYGHRYATKNTQFMSHRYYMRMEGTHSDLTSHTSELHIMHMRIIDHYHKCTGMDKTVLEQTLLQEHDIWMTAEQCKKYNIVDNIIPVKKRHFKDISKKETPAAKKSPRKKQQNG